MTYDIVLKDSSRITIGEEKYKKITEILIDEKLNPDFFEIEGWGIFKVSQIMYIQKEDDGRFRTEGY